MRAIIKIILCVLACLFLPSTISYIFGEVLTAFSVSISSWTFYEILGFIDIALWAALITLTVISIRKERGQSKRKMAHD